MVAATAVSGELDAATVAAVRPDLLRQVRLRGSRRLDVSGVTFLSCAGLGLLVELSATAEAAGRTLLIEGLRPPHAQLVRFFGLHEVLTIADPPVTGTGRVPTDDREEVDALP
ncbi:STAS domain-containing protein [Kineococcus glutinatus]|uniref:STAS domain-containing protein n=1 Tax=Kineococcus glutinatus TaxID=1070872 RepID=UPI0031EEA669